MKSTFVLKNRDYFLLFLGNMVSSLGTHIFNFAMSLYILVLTDYNAAIAGLYLAFGSVVYMVVSPFAGAIVDRMNKVRVVYLTDLINGVAILVAGYVIFTGLDVQTTIIVLYATSFVLGVNASLFQPSAASIPKHILDEHQLQQSSSLIQGLGAFYGIIGPIIGGILYGVIDIEFIFWINGISFLLSGISEFFIQVSTHDDEPHTLTIQSTLIDIRDGFKYLWKLKGIRNMLLIAAMLNFFTVPVIVNGFPYLFEVILRVDSVFLSMVMASFPVGIIISSVILGSKAQQDRVSPIMIKGLYGMSIAFSVFAVATYFVIDSSITFLVFMLIAVVSTIVTGFFNGFVNVPFSVAIQKSVDPKFLGRTFSVVSLIAGGITPIAIALGGIIIQTYGLRTLLVFATIAMFVTSFLTQINKEITKI